MKREHAATVERMERDAQRADEAYERSKGDSFMGDLGKTLFDQMTLVNEMSAQATKIGRQQMARDVVTLIRAGKPIYQVLDEIIALCKAEA